MIHDDPIINLDGSPQLSRHQAKYKVYKQYWQARKKKLSNKELMIRKNTKSLKLKDPGKHKFFIFHDRGHFAKVYAKSRKAKRVAQISKKTMDSQFPAKDEALHDLYPNPNDIS